jgi:hypothetical protein
MAGLLLCVRLPAFSFRSLVLQRNQNVVRAMDHANKYSANISQLRMKQRNKKPLQNLHANAFLVPYKNVKD